jgi:neutral ceramidase
MRNSFPEGADSVAVISLANGYLNYITTWEEYSAQHYEGASTTYGPGSAGVIAEQLAQLVAELGGAGTTVSSSSEIDSIVAYPGKHKAILPSFSSGPSVEEIERRIEEAECRGDTLVVRWIDAYPGRLIPADGPVLRIEREEKPGTWTTVAWDDDSHLEVRGIRALGRRGYLWEALWTPGGTTGRYRLALVERPGLPEITSDMFLGCR